MTVNHIHVIHECVARPLVRTYHQRPPLLTFRVHIADPPQLDDHPDVRVSCLTPIPVIGTHDPFDFSPIKHQYRMISSVEFELRVAKRKPSVRPDVEAVGLVQD